jgi:hypothetical protein
MKNQRKPIIVNSTTKLIDEIMENKKWSLVDAIESIESAYPFYSNNDVFIQFINFRLYSRALTYYLRSKFSKYSGVKLSYIFLKIFRD